MDIATETNQRFVVDVDGNIAYERWDAEEFARLLQLAECPTCYRRTGGSVCGACGAERRTERRGADHPLLVRA